MHPEEIRDEIYQDQESSEECGDDNPAEVLMLDANQKLIQELEEIN